MPALIRPPNHPLWRWNMRKYTTTTERRGQETSRAHHLVIITTQQPAKVKASGARRCGMRNYFIIAHFSPPRRRRGKKRRKQNLRARIDTCTAQHSTHTPTAATSTQSNRALFPRAFARNNNKKVCCAPHIKARNRLMYTHTHAML